MKLVAFCLLYLVAGYVLHNALWHLADAAAIDRTNACLNEIGDLFICLQQYEPKGWEKLVRF